VVAKLMSTKRRMAKFFIRELGVEFSKIRNERISYNEVRVIIIAVANS